MKKLTTMTITLAALAQPLAARGGNDDSGGGGASADEIAQAFVDQGAPEDDPIPRTTTAENWSWLVGGWATTKGVVTPGDTLGDDETEHS